MLVPSNRLLIWLIVVLPFAALGPMVPAASGVSLLVFAALGLVAVADALLSRGSARGLRVTIPEVVRLSKDRPGVIPVFIEHRADRAEDVVIGLPLPREIASEHETMTCRHPADTAKSSIDWACVAAARGRFFIDRCYHQVISPFGLWLARGSTPVRAEIRVYPNLLCERNRLAAIFLNRGDFGLHTQRMLGQGRDFEKLRDYIPGDSYDDIHWKATAKRGRPVTKLYQVERTQEIYVLVDHSRLSGRENGGEPALEHFLRSALVLGLVAEQQGDLFGLVTFSERVTRFIRASGGKAHYDACRDAIYMLPAETATPDFGELFSFIRLRLRRRALLLVLTDLTDPQIAESFLDNVRLICRQHVVLVSTIAQPGIGPVFAAAKATHVDDLYGSLGGHMVWQKVREVEKSLHHVGVGLSMVEDDRLSTELVTQYMSVKARQVL